nr:uncharacterized protein LOC129274044 [Lytechinus pictus]
MLYSKPLPYDTADNDSLRGLHSIPYAQRAGRSNLRHNGDSDQFRSPLHLFDAETDFSERTSDLFRSTTDRRMQQLAKVITHSPYLNEKMQSHITDVTSPSRMRAAPRSEFVRPYLATGQEEELYHWVSFDPTVRHTVWSVVVGMTVIVVGTMGTNQVIVQKYISLQSQTQAKM